MGNIALNRKTGKKMLKTVESILKKHLPPSLIESLSYLKHLNKKLPSYEIYQSHVLGKKGIEIGGPSLLFKTILPLYQKVEELDGVNFSNCTVWEGPIQNGKNFNYIGKKTGIQYITEATNLFQIESEKYDFLLSSNCLEHIANPLKALTEWKRIIRPGGALILVLPNKVSNFDHARPFTTFEHILEDFRDQTDESDLTHLEEILALHDLSMDPQAGNLDQFKQRSLDNINNRTLHHHVFNIDLIKKMLNHIGCEVIETNETEKNYYALAIS